MQKQDTTNPKQKNTTTKQKYKSQNRKTLRTWENRNINPKTEINIPKRKHIQNKNTKLNHKTEREFKNTNHDQKPQNRNKEIM